MFGYVTVNKPEIKFKDFDMYRSFYCGLCRELRERCGIPGQISLTYDMTFVVLLLSGLYEPPTRKGKSRCVVHPLKAQPVRKNEITEYCADMNVILSYYKCMDLTLFFFLPFLLTFLSDCHETTPYAGI